MSAIIFLLSTAAAQLFMAIRTIVATVPTRASCRVEWPVFGCLACCLAKLVLLIGPAPAVAGGGPENVLLVVNSKSSASLAIANHYLQWRSIPRRNVLYLSWPPADHPTDAHRTEVDPFRTEILQPIVQAIEQRHLAGQVSYIVYSSDFPWLVVMRSDFPQERKSPRGSLTSMTFLAPFTLAPELADRQRVIQRGNNPYFAAPHINTGETPASRAFEDARGSRPGGPSPSGRSAAGHFLSTMLGVTSGRGNSLQEVLDYLRRSASADSMQPPGTVYFMQNNGIRSRARQYAVRPSDRSQIDLFEVAVRQLQDLDVQAEVLPGILPKKKQDVMGLQVGAAKFGWPPVRSEILPGAICEHFTSYGGVMIEGEKREFVHQTPLSEFLRYGAAGASGTISEPFALRDKFPYPGIHVHYARGCTLAESFYQSVATPLQLLIVGDPLCQPWAPRLEIAVQGLKAEARVRGPLEIRPTVKTPDGVGIDRFELFVDGVRRQTVGENGSFSIDTTSLADGYHELRVVAITEDLVASQGRVIVPFHVDNRGRQVTVSLGDRARDRVSGPLQVTARAEGALALVLLQNRRVLQQQRGAATTFEVPSAALGRGPVQIQVMARFPNERPVFSPPLSIDVR